LFKKDKEKKENVPDRTESTIDILDIFKNITE
jgi:hypothetical protein